MQLSPGEQFVITRQLADPNDSDTSYVRATIRDAKTDELLSRVTLVDRGERRYSQAYQVPADVSGLGRWISIVTTVYTDSAFTSLNPNYSEEMSTYLVEQRRVNTGGFGGPDIDYKKIKEIVDKSVDEKVGAAVAAIQAITIPDPNVTVKAPDIDLSPVMELVRTLKVDLTPFVDAYAGLAEVISALPTEFETPNNDDVLEAIRGLSEGLNRIMGDIQAVVSEAREANENALAELSNTSADIKKTKSAHKESFALMTTALSNALAKAQEISGESAPEAPEEIEEIPAPPTTEQRAQALRSPVQHPFRNSIMRLKPRPAPKPKKV